MFFMYSLCILHSDQFQSSKSKAGCLLACSCRVKPNTTPKQEVETHSRALLPLTNMPPKTDEAGLDSHSAAVIFQTDSPISVQARPPEQAFRYLDLQQPLLLPSLANSITISLHEEACDELATDLDRLAVRVDEMRVKEKSTKANFSPVLDACRLSLRTRMPQVLEQASLLVQSVSSSENESTHLIGRLRASFAIMRAAQYVEIIESSLAAIGLDSIDGRLLSLIDSNAFKALAAEMQQDLSFRVSPWRASALAFDVPAGKMARSSVGGPMPLTVEVEPVIEFYSDSLLNDKDAMSSFRPCSLKIEKFSHSPCEFSAGSGTSGMARITVRLSPLESLEAECLGRDVQVLGIREARA
jgi:hypothetical protein